MCHSQFGGLHNADSLVHAEFRYLEGESVESIFQALSRAFRDLFQFQVLWIIVWPILAASLLWVVLGMAFWGTFSGWIAEALTAIADALQKKVPSAPPERGDNILPIAARG